MSLWRLCLQVQSEAPWTALAVVVAPAAGLRLLRGAVAAVVVVDLGLDLPSEDADAASMAWLRFFPKKPTGHCVNNVSMPSLPTSMKRILLTFGAAFAVCTLTFAAGPVNEVCPVKGKPIRLIFRTTYKGQVVAFCCQDCKAEFEKNPGRYQVKVAEPK